MIDQLETERLILRRPTRNDVLGIFTRYASDPEVTRYLAWPRHATIDDTLMFLDFSDSEWLRWGCGPLLVCSKLTGTMMGSTGLAFDSPDVAQIGYVFAADAWGRGYATESLAAIIELARGRGMSLLYAQCHERHAASAHVLEKSGFLRQNGVARIVFPNLSPVPQPTLRYDLTL